MPEPFRVQFVEGVTPDKWVRVWRERRPEHPLEVAPAGDDPAADLRAGLASMCFVRLPIERDGLHVIPLYEEVPVVVVAKEHAVAAFDEVAVSDLGAESLLQPPDDVPEWLDVAEPTLVDAARALPPMSVRTAVSVVAAGSGVLIVPMSVARLHHRKDVVHRPVTGVAASRIGLAWRVDDDDPRVEAFIGVVRGRTERSTRGAATTDASGSAPSTKSGSTSDSRSGSKPSPKSGASSGLRGGRSGQPGAPARGQRSGASGGARRGGSAGSRRKGRR